MRTLSFLTLVASMLSFACVAVAQSGIPSEQSQTNRVSTIAVPGDLSVANATEAVVRAGLGRRWNIVRQETGFVELHLLHRRHDARLFAYIDLNSIRIYSDSRRVGRDGRPGAKEDPAGWIKNLEKDIPVLLQRQAAAKD